jgi:hypothetical protein
MTAITPIGPSRLQPGRASRALVTLLVAQRNIGPACGAKEPTRDL